MDEKLFESEEINAWHKKLNSKEHSPRRGYRRNVRVYILVCYVNNIIGCFLSHNEGPIPVFLGRARKHMTDFPDSGEWHEHYKMAPLVLRKGQWLLGITVSSFDEYPDR